MRGFVRELSGAGGYLGAVALVARDGRIVMTEASGFQDLARRSPMQHDTIFRIYSITKIVATVGVLALEEEGRLSLDDPVGRHLAEFAGRPVTVRHLLTHTSGLAQADERVESAADLAQYAREASRLPQRAAPGTRFEYASVNTELASRIAELASGKPFDVFLRERVFAPLDMHDTAFTVPAAKRARLAQMTSTDREGRLVHWPAGEGLEPGGMMRRWMSGAGGLYSTAPDLARFGLMLANGGELDGARILARASVERMMTNQLGHLSPPVSQYGEGFGLGGFVNLDTPGRPRPGSVGAFGWSGAAATYFAVDRRERLVMILLMQHLPQGLPRDPEKPSFRFYHRVYGSPVH